MAFGTLDGFYQGYGKTEINMAILVYYRHERIVDIAFKTDEGGNNER